jgi:hypothetical protein
MVSIVAALLALAVILPFAVTAIVLRGWVLTYLWLWFIVPFGAPVLTIPMAIGLTLLVNYLSGAIKITKDEKPIIDVMIEVFASPFIVLGMGYIIHHFFVK